MVTPVLETNRLILRTFNDEDINAVFNNWETDPDVAKYMFWTSHNDINKTKEWVKEEISKINSDTWYRWAIESKEDGELVGTCLIYLEEEYGEFEIAYNLSKKSWGKGYTTEAMKKVLEFAKYELGIKLIMGRCAKENAASGNVMKKLGFKFNKSIPYECNEGKSLYEGEEYIYRLGKK